MRRPLFMVCLCLVIMAFCRVSDTDWTELDELSCVVTGQVYQKEVDCFYLESVMIKEADVKASNSNISEKNVAIQQQTIPFTENLICEYDEQMEVRIGSTVQISGTFHAFSKATNPGEFDMAGYYHSLKIGGKLQNVTVLSASDNYSRWREILFGIRGYFRERLYDIFPQKEASVMCAMLLGDKKELDVGVKELYQRNGIVHILSISGLHITIIGMSIYRLLRKLGVPVWLSAIFGGGILLLYGVMTGMSVSACRAIGMYLLRMLAEVMGRTYDMLTALGLLAALIVWCNPGYLQNAGFYLSFGAVLGIGVLYPALQPAETKTNVLKYEGRKWKRIVSSVRKQLGNGLRQSMLSGLSVTLLTLPIQLWFYYEVPVYSIGMNLLVIPFMSTVMVCGLLAMLLPGFGVVGTIDCIILNGYEMLCELFERLPFHTWNPGRPEVWQVVIYYLLLLGSVVVWCWKKDKEYAAEATPYGLKGLRLVQIMGLLMAIIVLALHTPAETTITFLDVGQGDCICMQLASGEVYLFDCGSSSRSKVGEYVLKPYLKYCGIDYIDAVFVSHPDKDHSNGVLELLHHSEEWGIGVGQLVLPDLEPLRCEMDFGDFIQMAEKMASERMNETIKMTEKETAKKTTVFSVEAGDFWEVGDNRFVCLHPAAASDLKETNAYSQCFYVEFETGQSLLLTGDVEAEGEEMLLAELKKRNIEDITLLKVAHHGSKYSSSPELLNIISPQLAIISCGKNNSYGHPHAETLERLETVDAMTLSTPNSGAVIVTLGDETEVYQYRGLTE